LVLGICIEVLPSFWSEIQRIFTPKILVFVELAEVQLNMCPRGNVDWRAAIRTASVWQYAIINTRAHCTIGGSQQAKTFSEVLVNVLVLR
jgi:hypothetical protein